MLILIWLTSIVLSTFPLFGWSKYVSEVCILETLMYQYLFIRKIDSSNSQHASFCIYLRHIWWGALLTCTHNPGTVCRTVWCCLFTVSLCPSASSSFHTLGSFTIPELAGKGYLVIMSCQRSKILEKILIEGFEEDNPLTPIKG